MSSENLKIDENTRWALGALTNDANLEIKNLRVNPTNGRLLVSAVVTASNTSIGSTIPGGTQGSVLFLGPGSTLAEDNANFFYDDTSNFLGLGTNTPNATLHVSGSVQFDLGGDATGDIFYRDAGGNLINLPVGADGDVLTVVLGVPAWVAGGGGGTGYDLFQNQGVSVTQRTTVNLTSLLTASDVGGKTELDINVANLAADATFTSTLDLSTIGGLLDLSTQVTGLLDVSNIDVNSLANDATFITALEPNLDLANIGGSLDLTTQVTGVLPIANGGTNSGTALSGSTIMISNGSAIVQGTAGTTTTVLHGNAGGAPSYGAVVLTTDVSGVLPLANGGTGSNLSDPGANRLWGWDDTDNSIGFWTIGSGLSYDHGTHTLSSSGTSNFTVNADEAITAWSTSPMVIDSDLGWTVSGAGFTAFANGWIITANTIANASIAVFGVADLGGGGTPQANSFASGTWRVRIKGQIAPANAATPTTTTMYSWFGLSSSSSSQTNGDITDVTDRVGIAIYDGKIYHVTADGTTVTATQIGTRASDQWDIVIVDFDRTTARFWLNGTPYTSTTTVPNSGNVLVAMGGYNSGGSAGGLAVISPTISVTYNA